MSDPIKLSIRNLVEPLLVIFNKAVSEVFQNREYYIGYSVPGGVYGYFDDYELTDQDVKKLKSQIKKNLKNGLIFHQSCCKRDQAIRYFEKIHREDILELLYSRNAQEQIDLNYHFANLNGSGELFMSPIDEHYELLSNFQLFKFNKGFFLIADPAFFERVMPKQLHLSKYLKRFEESEEAMKQLGISSLAQLNEAIEKGRLSEFIKISEAYQAKRIGRIADNIVSHPLKPRLIFLAGPTSSGKTTSANRLAIELKVIGKEVLIMSLDNFYLPHSKIPHDPISGLQNFELITALDLKLFGETIKKLMQGESVHLPRYHFDGKGATPEPIATRITPETYIIVEGIHGLNPELWKDAMDIDSYRLYVSALNTLNIHNHLPLSTSDHRLIRRLVRDHLFRGYDFNETIKRWPDVMINEYHSIFPFQESAHAIFNSSLIYEIAVFAHYAPKILIPEKSESEIIRARVNKLNNILSLLNPIDPKDIPPTSVLREFIGGSSFTY